MHDVRSHHNPGKSDKGKAAKILKNEWDQELKEIQKCIDCYHFWTTSEAGSDYFTLVCSEPHLLVYVQESESDGSRWWPAKVISVDGNSTVTIQCFGDHLRADYKFEQCNLYSDTEDDLRKKMEIAQIAMKSKKRIKMKKEYKCAFEVRKNLIHLQMSILFFFNSNLFLLSIFSGSCGIYQKHQAKIW